MRRWGLWVGGTLVVVCVVLAMSAPLIATHPPSAQDLDVRLQPPFWAEDGTVEHLIGTDHLGRDIFSRLVFGMRTSIVIGVVTAVVSAVVGTVLGVIAAYRGGWVSTVVLRALDVQTAFPFLVIAIAVVAAMGPSAMVIIVTLALWTWVPFGRVAHATGLRLRSAEYVQVAEISGGSTRHVLSRHILPNTVPSALVIWSFTVAQVIVAESALSFLGLGIQPPAPSLGRMVTDGRDFLGLASWMALAPAVAITALVLGVNLLGDWLRDVRDPYVGRGGLPAGP